MSGKLLLAHTLVAALVFATAPPVFADGEPGSWQTQKSELDYMGFTTTYSCEGLQSKLELLLRKLGARSDAKVETFGCDRGYGVPSRFARARLNFAALQPAADGADPAVPGSWRRIEFAPNRPFGLQDGDCELIEQFRDKVLPLFATRTLENRSHCVPHQASTFSLQFQVFAPLPAARSK
ncbi:MAG TPA: hypothetical protein VII17_02910 [Steroidobacteraceae bacterium]